MLNELLMGKRHVRIAADIGTVTRIDRNAEVAAVPTAILGWRWWKHRAENGIKF